ncbi:MAG: potassium channel family protein [Desulfobacterales bacterium]|nr:potassium channel family protein [Desulfobacterales bacterium]
MGHRHPVLKRIIYNRLLFLLATLALYIGLGPFLREFIKARVLMDILFTFILISGTYAIGQNKRQIIISVVFAIPMLISIWIAHFIKTPATAVTADVLTIIFLTHITLVILKNILTEKEITIDIIFSAVAAYLLMGVIWAILFSLLDVSHPGSFSVKDGPLGSGGYLFIYYSFTTLTTLGYGDVLPLTDKAAALAIFEAITGQIYLTVVIARLVGLHISQSVTEKK